MSRSDTAASDDDIDVIFRYRKGPNSIDDSIMVVGNDEDRFKTDTETEAEASEVMRVSVERLPVQDFVANDHTCRRPHRLPRLQFLPARIGRHWELECFFCCHLPHLTNSS